MEDFFDNDLVNEFENLLENNKSIYFDSDEFNEIITFYLDIYDFEYANKALLIALNLYPESLDLKIKQLEYYVGVEDLETASSFIESLKDYCFNNNDYLIASARYWSLKKLHHKSIELYLTALENHEEENYIYNCIGNEYLELNKPKEALEAYKSALKFNLKDDYALLSCIHCYEVSFEYNNCITFLNDYIDNNPYSEEAWFQLGLQYLNINNYKQGLISFDYVIIINPKSIAGYSQKAFCYEKLELWEKAIETYEESLAFDDTAAFTFLKIGLAYNKLKKHDLAMKAFYKSTKEDPQFDKAWFEISDLFDLMNDKEEALVFIKKALEIETKEVSYWKKYAYLNVQLGNYQEASDAFEIIIDLEPDTFHNWLAYSELLINMKEYSKAIIILKNSLKTLNRAEIYYQLGNCYFLINDIEKGNNCLKMALKLNPYINIEMKEKYSILLKNNK
ncbi:tetratricopeptide repeat protein [Apibacter muscae]|uniref:Tetratricopeptide repeat protein n=1 Tax=Apibacter muscae TaxID=2509004 RepID=A0A563DG80_9FLAO|nr:tetratricopeptide repeat protein [Apibacter muscae]TWP29137.1 tetratricopeptide repeat protein [Apibacter muscae]